MKQEELIKMIEMQTNSECRHIVGLPHYKFVQEGTNLPTIQIFKEKEKWYFVSNIKLSLVTLDNIKDLMVHLTMESVKNE